MEMDNPPHPPETLQEDCLTPLGLTVTAAAEWLGVFTPVALGTAQRPQWRLGRHGDPAGKSPVEQCRNLARGPGGL
jgi:hypothetical protein